MMRRRGERVCCSSKLLLVGQALDRVTCAYCVCASLFQFEFSSQSLNFAGQTYKESCSWSSQELIGLYGEAAVSSNQKYPNSI